MACYYTTTTVSFDIKQNTATATSRLTVINFRDCPDRRCEMYPHGYLAKNSTAMYVGLLSAPVYEESFGVSVNLSVRHRDQDIWVSIPKQPVLRDGGDESTKRWVGQAGILPFDTLARLPEPSILEFVAVVQLRTASRLGVQPVMTGDVRRQRILRSDWAQALVSKEHKDDSDRLTLHSQAIAAHRSLLAVRAPALLEAWRAWDQKRRAQTSAVAPLLNEFDPLALKCVLAYLYTGDIVLQETLTVAQALDVLAVSLRYELWPLVSAAAAAVGAFVAPGNVAKALYRVNRFTDDDRLHLPDAHAQHGVRALRSYLSRYIDAHSSEVVACEIARLTKEVSTVPDTPDAPSEEKKQAPQECSGEPMQVMTQASAGPSSQEEEKKDVRQSGTDGKVAAFVIVS